MSRKSNRQIKLVAISLIAVALVLSLLFTITGGFIKTTTTPSEIGTQTDGTPLMLRLYQFNVSVTDIHESPLKNAWVIVFDSGNIAKAYGYTNESGMISFELTAGEYFVQFEKYHYTMQSQQVTIDDEGVDLVMQMELEEVMIFGSIPSWMIMVAIGLIVFGLIFWNRKSLNLGFFGKPDNWFGKAKSGSWTFIEQSTKTVLYSISIILLIILLIAIIPNFPTFKDMAFYYVILGLAAVGGLLIEGSNRNSWIAAIGFGKSNQIIGNISYGIAFALIFLGITGFISQLSFFNIQVTSTLIPLIMFVVVASFFEEGFFSGVLAPTLAEKTGMLPTLFIVSVLFMFAHGFAYGWALPSLFIAFIFRFFATIIVFQTKSWLGVFIAHAFINALGLFSFIIFN